MPIDELTQSLPCTCKLNPHGYCPQCKPADLERAVAQRNWMDVLDVQERDVQAFLSKTIAS